MYPEYMQESIKKVETAAIKTKTIGLAMSVICSLKLYEINLPETLALIEKAIKFKRWTDYKSLNKRKFEKIEKKIIEYKENVNTNNLDLKEYEDFEEFSKDILDYIKGVNIYEWRGGERR